MNLPRFGVLLQGEPSLRLQQNNLDKRSHTHTATLLRHPDYLWLAGNEGMQKKTEATMLFGVLLEPLHGSIPELLANPRYI